MATTDRDERTHIADLIKEAKVAMLTTTTAQGRHVSRPMALQEVEPDGAEYWEGSDSTVAHVAQVLRAAVTKDPDRDPIHHDTVDL